MNVNTLNPAAEDIKPAPEARERALKLLLWLGQVSIGMLFAGLTSAYMVRRAAGNWAHFALPSAFFVSTAIIIISSVTMNMAMQAVKKNALEAIPRAILITFILGIAFGVCQFFAWMALIKDNVYLTGTLSNPAGSFLYIITALHLAHIVGGLVALAFTFFKARAKKYAPSGYLGMKLCATYWHFLDGLWVYLFIFMLIMR